MRCLIILAFLSLCGAASAWADGDPQIIELTDGWAIHAGEIVEPQAATEGTATPVTVPHVWRGMSGRGPDGAYGVATYVRHVVLPGPGRDFALVPGKIRTVYRYYAVVGDPATGARVVFDLGGNGMPGPDAEAASHHPPPLMSLPFDAREFDLVVQVSNDIHFMVGMIRAPEICPAGAARQFADQMTALSLAYVGLLVAVGLYTMLLAFWHAGESYYYVSCALLVTMACRLMLIDGYVWIFLPDLTVTTVLRAEYVTYFIMMPGLYALTYGLYPADASTLALKACLAVGAGASLMAIFAPAPWVFALRDPYMILSGIMWLLVLAAFLRARANRRDGASVALLGLVVIAVAMALDILLYARGRPSGTENVPIASLMFAVILMWLFTARYRKEQAERATMARVLADANTALNQRARELDKAQEEASAALAMKASFLANVSHEVRTPLNAIIGFSDLLISQSHAPADMEKQREYLRLIRNNGQHLLTLMTDILSVSDLEAGRFEVSPTVVDPREAVEMSVGLVAPVAHEKQLFLDVKCATADLRTDERLMRQAIIKILANAVKYSPECGVVTVRGSVVAGDYLLTVTDTGPGIAEKDLPTALSLFGRIGSAYTANKGGMGLGLPLVSRFMELLGGRLHIDTIADVGTTVTLSFPLGPTENGTALGVRA